VITLKPSSVPVIKYDQDILCAHWRRLSTILARSANTRSATLRSSYGR
jgi:hypothetical protein